MVERAAAQVYRPSPPLNPGSLDFAIAEIAARQSELDYTAPRPVAHVAAPPMAHAMPAGPDFSALERHLVKITSQIEALRRPDGVDNRSPRSAANCRDPSRHHRGDAAPGDQIDRERNPLAVAPYRRHPPERHRQPGLEPASSALGDIREALRSPTPAEQLAGYDEAIRNLGGQARLDPAHQRRSFTIHQLEGAIAALRSIVFNVASNDALARLSDDLHTLSSKVDSSPAPKATAIRLRCSNSALLL